MPPLSASAIAAERCDAIEHATDAIDTGHARVKLLLLTDTSIAFAGGSERFLRNLVTLLPRDRYSITWCSSTAATTRHAGTHLLADVRPCRPCTVCR